MDVNVRAVQGDSMIVGAGLIMVSRIIAERNNAIPDRARVEAAKQIFESHGVSGATSLLEVVQSLESEDRVVGYFGFTLDRHGITRRPPEEQADGNHFMQVMCLPHPEFGSRRGKATVVSNLVEMAELPEFKVTSADQLQNLSDVLGQAAAFLSRGHTSGEA